MGLRFEYSCSGCAGGELARQGEFKGTSLDRDVVVLTIFIFSRSNVDSAVPQECICTILAKSWLASVQSNKNKGNTDEALYHHDASAHSPYAV